jgi:phosphate transport system substrate-binding protein
VRFLLSREGQQEVQHEGRYMPLTGAMVREELKKLD